MVEGAFSYLTRDCKMREAYLWPISADEQGTPQQVIDLDCHGGLVGALKAVGIILVIAMLVAPGAIAFLLTDRFERMLVLASMWRSDRACSAR